MPSSISPAAWLLMSSPASGARSTCPAVVLSGVTATATGAAAATCGPASLTLSAIVATASGGSSSPGNAVSTAATLSLSAVPASATGDSGASTLPVTGWAAPTDMAPADLLPTDAGYAPTPQPSFLPPTDMAPTDLLPTDGGPAIGPPLGGPGWSAPTDMAPTDWFPTDGGFIPAGPASLFATPGDASVGLSWPAVAGATTYTVLRGTSPGGESATPVATGIAATAYVDSGLANGTAYYYAVLAVSTYGPSGPSPEASATPHALPTPGVPGPDWTQTETFPTIDRPDWTQTVVGV